MSKLLEVKNLKKLFPIKSSWLEPVRYVHAVDDIFGGECAELPESGGAITLDSHAAREVDAKLLAGGPAVHSDSDAG